MNLSLFFFLLRLSVFVSCVCLWRHVVIFISLNLAAMAARLLRLGSSLPWHWDCSQKKIFYVWTCSYDWQKTSFPCKGGIIWKFYLPQIYPTGPWKWSLSMFLLFMTANLCTISSCDSWILASKKKFFFSLPESLYDPSCFEKWGKCHFFQNFCDAP